MTEPIIVQSITTLGLVLVAVLQVIAHRRTKELSEDVRVVRGQTENEHKDAQYPNLRDELTAIRLGLERADARTERYIHDVDADQKATRDALDRHIDAADRIVEDAKRDMDARMAALVAEGMRAHTSDCAMRSQSAIISITNP